MVRGEVVFMVGFATSSGCNRPARSRDGARECPDGPPRTRLSLATASKYPSSGPLAHRHASRSAPARHDSFGRRRPPARPAGAPPGTGALSTPGGDFVAAAPLELSALVPLARVLPSPLPLSPV